MRRDIAVVILAGGEGSRIGGGKPHRLLAGEPLIDRALRTAHRWSDLVAVAVREPAQVAGIDARLITDEPDIGGPLAGLAAALRFGAESNRDFVLTIPVDTPFLPADLPGRLREGIGKSNCAIASASGHLHPACGLWRTSAASQLGDFLAGERRSLKAFAELIGFRDVEWSRQPFDPFFNINTADDLADAELRVRN